VKNENENETKMRRKMATLNDTNVNADPLLHCAVLQSHKTVIGRVCFQTRVFQQLQPDPTIVEPAFPPLNRLQIRVRLLPPECVCERMSIFIEQKYCCGDTRFYTAEIHKTVIVYGSDVFFWHLQPEPTTVEPIFSSVMPCRRHLDATPHQCLTT
jgi:hypothetical protein